MELIEQIYKIFEKGGFSSAKRKLKRLGFIPTKGAPLGKTSLVDIFRSEYEVEFPERTDRKRYLAGSFHFGVKDVPNIAFLYFGEDYFDRKTKTFDNAHLAVWSRELSVSEQTEITKSFERRRQNETKRAEAE